MFTIQLPSTWMVFEPARMDFKVRVPALNPVNREHRF
jgi:hypothetical protein